MSYTSRYVSAFFNRNSNHDLEHIIFGQGHGTSSIHKGNMKFWWQQARKLEARHNFTYSAHYIDLKHDIESRLCGTIWSYKWFVWCDKAFKTLVEMWRVWGCLLKREVIHTEAEITKMLFVLRQIILTCGWNSSVAEASKATCIGDAWFHSYTVLPLSLI